MGLLLSIVDDSVLLYLLIYLLVLELFAVVMGVMAIRAPRRRAVLLVSRLLTYMLTVLSCLLTNMLMRSYIVGGGRAGTSDVRSCLR